MSDKPNPLPPGLRVDTEMTLESLAEGRQEMSWTVRRLIERAYREGYAAGHTDGRGEAAADRRIEAARVAAARETGK